MKYHNKPVEIDAEQFDPQQQPWPAYIVPWPENGARPRDMSFGYIETREVRMHVKAGDWIITDASGSHYPIREDVFHILYEPVG